MRFDIDEPLYPPHHALPGLLTGKEIDALEREWGATKVDEWCAVSALKGAVTDLRVAVAAPTDAPLAVILRVAEREAGSRTPQLVRALSKYRAAVVRHGKVRAQLADIRRRRALADPAA